MASTMESLTDLTDAFQTLQDEYSKLQDHLTDIELKYQSALNKVMEDKEEKLTSKLKKLIAELFNSELYSDVMIILNNDTKIFGHKLILSAISGSWHQELKTCTELHLKDNNTELVHDVIKWIYTEEIQLKEDDVYLCDLFKMSSINHLKPLIKMCEEKIISKLTGDNIQTYIKLSEEVQSSTLKDYCMEYISKNTIVKMEPPDVIDSDEESQQSFETQDEVKENDSVLRNIKKEPSNGTTKNMSKVYPCPKCHLQYRTKAKFKEHVEKHASKSFNCDLCEKVFDNPVDLSLHKRYHTGKKPFACDICSKSYCNSQDLRKHKELHKDKTFPCPKCDKTFPTKIHLSKHLKNHKGLRPFKCPECDKTFSRKAHLKLHEAIHTGFKKYSCDRCFKVFSDSSNFTRHYKTHTGQKDYKCDLCGKCFIQSSELKRHKNQHHSVLNNSVETCNICGKVCESVNELLEHLVAHPDQMVLDSIKSSFVCDLCSKTFVEEEHLHAHKESEHRINQIYQCNHCTLTFSKLKDLTDHVCPTSKDKLDNVVILVHHKEVGT